VLAGIISGLVACDVHRIEPVDPYPDAYQETVSRNVREQEAAALPPMVNPLVSIEAYDVVLLGSPIWNVRAPMIMSTFAESLDFTGKTIFPFTTYAGERTGNDGARLHLVVPGAQLSAKVSRCGGRRSRVPVQKPSHGCGESVWSGVDRRTTSAVEAALGLADVTDVLFGDVWRRRELSPCDRTLVCSHCNREATRAARGGTSAVRSTMAC
jgi:hypothetical protein